jgi:hypothetical protein
MTDTPEAIWRWAVQNCGGFIEYSDLPVISEHATSYTRTDIHDAAKARIAELENKLKLAASALDEASEYSSGLKSYADNLRAALKVTT